MDIVVELIQMNEIELWNFFVSDWMDAKILPRHPEAWANVPAQFDKQDMSHCPEK